MKFKRGAARERCTKRAVMALARRQVQDHHSIQLAGGYFALRELHAPGTRKMKSAIDRRVFEDDQT